MSATERVIDQWDGLVARVTPCSTVVRGKVVMRHLEEAVCDLGEEAVMAAVRKVPHLRGFFIRTRLSFGRLFDTVKGKGDRTLLERLAAGEYDSWRWPQPTCGEQPTLDEILHHDATPLDWLLPPEGLVSDPGEGQCLLYCARAFKRAARNDYRWLLWRFGANRERAEASREFRRMRGLLHPVLREACWNDFGD